MKNPFTEQDQRHFDELGIPRLEVERQWAVLKKGLSYLKIDRPCTPGDGIRILTALERDRLATSFEKEIDKGRVLKFVPASGAATRMFRDLIFLYRASDIPKQKFSQTVAAFFNNLDRFPFYPELKSILSSQGQDLNGLLQTKDYTPILAALFSQDTLDFIRCPKGLLPFHRYGEEKRSAFEEHLVEALHYGQDRNNLCRIHFTVRPDHLKKVQDHLENVVEKYKTAGVQFDISFSVQKKSTQTISVDSEFRPVRMKGGDLLFRPGGHGTLISNLEDIQGDLIFIKNIDNVTVDSKRGDTYLYKKALGGYLVEIQTQIFSYLKLLEENKMSEAQIEQARVWVASELGIEWGSEWENLVLKEKQSALTQVLNRPIRVCGMVPNRGEAGGGPFWVPLPEGGQSCQIVESAQVDHSDSGQEKTFQASTHFNPVDLVCGVKNFRGRKFDLSKFIDPKTSFISHKSLEGKDILVLEHPGLWNGAMAGWITLFVEAPLSTFSPVKTVNDLLRPEHQI